MHSLLIADLAIVTAVGAVTGILARRLGQPAILGYLFAGLLVGPYIPIPLFADPERMAQLAEVGVVLVMFAVGLEFRVARLLEILPRSGLAAVVQIGVLGWAGFTLGALQGWPIPAAITLGAALAISSTMVVSSVLRAHPLDPDVRSHVFGILVVQDVAAILLMAVVTGLAAGTPLGLASLGTLVAQLVGAVAVMLLVSLLTLPRLVRHALDRLDGEVVVVLLVGAAFGLALVAEHLGYSVALGAFLAGMAVAESGRGHQVEERIEPLRSLFSAVFFVSIGMSVDPAVALGQLPLAGAIIAVVVLGQLLSITVGTVLTGATLRRGVYSGLALGQLGELSFILATIGIAGGVVPAELLPALVTAATITTFTTPLLLSRAPRILRAIDHAVPPRLHEALASYQSLLSGLGGGADEVQLGLRRAAIAVVADWLALVVLVVGHETVLGVVGDPRLTVDLVTGALALPFLVGLVRSGRKLVRLLRQALRADRAPGPRLQAVESLALLAVVLGVGVPTVALLGPLVQGLWLEGTLGLLGLGALALVARRLGALEGQETSGVGRIAQDVAFRVGAAPTEPVPERGVLDGLDYESMTVQEGSEAAGRELREIDLRCRTGATLVAIWRGEETLALPTGHDVLLLGDVVAVSGTDEARARARALVEGPARP